MLMDIRDMIQVVLDQNLMSPQVQAVMKQYNIPQQTLGNNALVNNFIRNPQSGRILPQSPYYQLTDAQAIQDPEKRQEALNNATMGMVMGMTTPVEPKPTAKSLTALVESARGVQRDSVIVSAQNALDRIHQSPTGVRDYAPVYDFLKNAEAGKDTPDQMRAVQELLALHGEANLSTKLPTQVEGKYLYHGTGETALENIAKEGLKPGRHTGNISLSPNEAYAQNWAKGGITPQGKTEGVMLRVNQDLLKTKILPSKSGVKADQLNELISKEVIPPEALEIFKDGKWQPLKSLQVEGLAKEASKYKSAEEFVKGQGKPLYHGTNEIFETFDANKARALGERGDNLWGAGFYTSPGSKTAKNYGENLMELYGKPKKTLDLSKFKTTKQLGEHLNISEDALMMRNGIPTAKGSQAQQLSSHAKELGYDSIFTPVGEGEMVILDPSLVKTKSQLTDIFNQSKGVQNKGGAK